MNRPALSRSVIRLTVRLASAMALVAILAPVYAVAGAPDGVQPGGEPRRLTISPMDNGCAGDGVTDDTACVSAAVRAASASGAGVELGPHLYLLTSGLAPARALSIECVGSGWPSNKSSGLRAGVANLTLLKLPTGSSLRGCYIDMTNKGAFVDTSGAAISLGASTDSVIIDGVWIDAPCIGIDLSGTSNIVSNSLIGSVRGRGCDGIRVGFYTTGAGTTDPRIVDSTITGNPADYPDADLDVRDAGGLFLMGDDFLFGKVGTLIAPGAAQQVAWAFIANTALGDTTDDQALVINTAAPNSVVQGLSFVGDWAASARNADNVGIANDGGGKVTGLWFLAFRSMNNGNGAGGVFDGVKLAGGIDITFDASHICGFNGYGLEGLSGVSHVSVTDTEISPSCGGGASAGTVGVMLRGANANWKIAGNDFSGIRTPVSGLITSGVVADNLGLDSGLRTVASAATIELDAIDQTWRVSGSATVSRIGGAWPGRTIRLIMTGQTTFASDGGNICSTLTAAAGTTVEGWYGGACWYLK